MMYKLLTELHGIDRQLEHVDYTKVKEIIKRPLTVVGKKFYEVGGYLERKISPNTENDIGAAVTVGGTLVPLLLASATKEPDYIPYYIGVAFLLFGLGRAIAYHSRYMRTQKNKFLH